MAERKWYQPGGVVGEQLKKGPLGMASDLMFGEQNHTDFKARDPQGYDTVSSTYQPAQLKAGQGYDPTTGVNQYLDAEQRMGVKAFDGDAYRAALQEGLSASTGEATRREEAKAGDFAAAGNLGRSGMARALTMEARGHGDRTLALGTANIAMDAAGKEQAENQFRMGGAMETGRFGAGFNEGQRQFDASFGEGQRQFSTGANFTAQGMNEQARIADNAANYGMDMDTYYANIVAPRLIEEQRRGAALKTGTDLASAGIQAGGNVAGSAAKAGVT